MPIDPDKLQRLLELKNKPKPRRGGGRKKSGVDTSVRTYETWFKLHTHVYDNAGEKLSCDNPNCLDPREDGKVKMIAEVDGVNMCRYCFLGGYGLENPAQGTIEELAS